MSIGFLSLGYLLAFKGALGFIRSNRLLGPLRVTLTKMLWDLLQFFVIFVLLMLAYTLSLTEIYWYYGTEEGTEAFCKQKNRPGENICPSTEAIENVCYKPVFSNVIRSAQSLFWALFGLDDINCIREDKSDDTYVDDIAIGLVAVYHVSVVFILLNMLIAMMTKSYDVASENKDAEWKYYRTQIWIQFICKDHSGPPPMNLLWIFYVVFKSFEGKRNKKYSYDLPNTTSEQDMRDTCNKLIEKYKNNKTNQEVHDTKIKEDND